MDNPDRHSISVGVPREVVRDEQRVALTPDTTRQLAESGLTVLVESGAGEGASFDDESYFDAGASLESRPAAVHRQADILVKVQPPTLEEVELIRPGALVISFLDSRRDAEVIASLSERGVIAFSFNAVPRITRAQSMDAMSSMSTVSGYKAVLVAANAVGRFFPLLMTAAGTVPPARVFVIGAGVAGLQALATARRLGAVTEACDTRPAVEEQVRSVGASFVCMTVPQDAEDKGGYARELDEGHLRVERDAIRDSVAAADVVIATALVPGARAPVLIDEAMVRSMRAGSVIVDIAAESGGNCELTVAGCVTAHHGVMIIGAVNLPSTLPVHASQMYSKNAASVIQYLVRDGVLTLNPEDEIVRSACLTGLAAVAR
ncbi:MAG TPA: Re/Si-specific NAD(P)(+) transhydrogenase subunit alpha [Chloroflexota bacterium]